MLWILPLGVVTLSALSANALIRFACSQLVTERFDPLLTPGEISPHLHQVVGGNAFNLTMDPGDDLPQLATCTTCRFKEDKSNYWTAVLFFKHPNGSYIRVNQMANPNTGPGVQAGGMTVYYFQPYQNFTIFPKGFRMTVGNARRRANDIDSKNLASRATSFRCLGEPVDQFGTTPGWAPEVDSFELPNRPCRDGIRSSIYFPQCWDGVNIDSPDHQSHVVHPDADPADGNGFFHTPCPASHPVRLPELFIDIVWDTRPFNDLSLWPKDGSQPFVLSMGDPHGFGQHADYIFGWEGDSLKRAMEHCTGGSGIPWDCPVLSLQDMETMNDCKVPVKVEEVVEGQYLEALPGCNPLQAGPQSATIVPSCTAPSTTVNSPVPTIPLAAVTPPWAVCDPATTVDPNPVFARCNDYPGPTPANALEPTATPPPAMTGSPLANFP